MPPRLDPFIPTRRNLLSRLRAWDDKEGWDEFFSTYGKFIYDVAIKSGLQDAEAQDVLQETVVSVAKAMPGFRYDPKLGSFKGWLRRIIQRRVSDHLRRKLRKEPLLADQELREGSGGNEFDRIVDPSESVLERLWDAEWDRHLLALALDRVRRRVSARQFQIFDCYVLQQMPLRKVTRTLGVSAGQAYLAKHRISRLLKLDLKEVEQEMASGGLSSKPRIGTVAY